MYFAKASLRSNARVCFLGLTKTVFESSHLMHKCWTCRGMSAHPDRLHIVRSNIARAAFKIVATTQRYLDERITSVAVRS